MVYKPIPPSIRNNKKFLNPFQISSKVLQVISERNFLMENCQNDRKEGVYFNLIRLIKKKVTGTAKNLFRTHKGVSRTAPR